MDRFAFIPKYWISFHPVIYIAVVLWGASPLLFSTFIISNAQRMTLNDRFVFSVKHWISFRAHILIAVVL